MTVRLLMASQLRFLVAAGFEVGVAAAPPMTEIPGVSVFPVPALRRQYAPLGDMAAFAQLVGVIRRFRPHIVNAGTPKAGLLGMLAAHLMRVPVRVYTLRGLRLETATGPARGLLRLTERLAAGSAHRVVCVSESLRHRSHELGVASAEKTVVLGHGSSNGVDVARFHPGLDVSPEVSALRERLGIPSGVPVVGFVGRMTKDKGIDDLCEAFVGSVAVRHPKARLLLVGDFEGGDPVDARTIERLRAHPGAVRTGFVDDAAPYYGLMTLLVLPSYREGFPNAPLEGAACGLPVVGYRATGTVDAVEDGATGSLVDVGDARALARAICGYLDDPELARRHGEAGRIRIEGKFRQDIVWRNWVEEYQRLIEERASETGLAMTGTGNQKSS